MLTVGRQNWRDLLFVHWSLPPEAIAPHLPPELELDLWQGQAYVTRIPFSVEASRPALVPTPLGMDFLEVNLRTYVRPKGTDGRLGEPGIFFFSLEASSWLSAAGARMAYGLPYFPARMRMSKRGLHFDYESRRILGSAAALSASWDVKDAVGPASPGTLEYFLVERYLLYVTRIGRLLRARVRHRPYPLFRVDVSSLSESLIQAAGLPSVRSAPIAQFSSGVDVDIEWLQGQRSWQWPVPEAHPPQP